MYIRHGRVVLGHADIVQREKTVSALKALEIGVNQRSGDFSGAVGTEVEEDDRVISLHACALGADDRNDEFVGDVLAFLVDLLIGSLDRRDRIGILDALAVHNSGVCLDNALPAVVSVHGVISAHDGGNLAYADFCQLIAELCDVIRAGSRRNVTAVEEAMHINLTEAVLLSHFHNGVEMGDVAVNAAVTHKTHKVQSTAVCLAVFHCALESLIVKEIAVLDGLGNSGQFLVDDSAGAHVGVTDFAVAHLSVGKSDSHSRSADGGVGAFREEFIKIRLGSGDNGVAVSVLDSVAVHYAKNKGFFHNNLCSFRLLFCIQVSYA